MWYIDLAKIQWYYEKGHAKGRSPMREGWQKKEVKKTNMVDVLSTQEWI
jgi:hypothetical protein